MPEESKEKRSSKSVNFRSVWKWTGISILCIFGLLILSVLLVQIPSVQSWLGKKFTASIAKDWGREVSLERVHLRIFDGLVLKNVFVQDQDYDTLMYVGELHSSLKRNILSVLHGRLDLEEIHLNNAKLNLEKYADGGGTNLSLFLKNFQKSNNNSKPGKPLELDVRRVILDQVIYTQVDNESEQGTYVELDYGLIEFNEIDLSCQLFHIHNIDLRHPIVQVYKHKLAEPDTNKVVEEHTDGESISQSVQNPFSLQVDKMQVTNGVFQLLNLAQDPNDPQTFDPDNLNLTDLDIELNDLRYFNWNDWFLQLSDLSFLSDQGFQMDFAKSDQIIFNKSGFQLLGFNAKTPESYVSSEVKLKYRSLDDFRDFGDKVIIQAEFKNSKIALKELLFFLPELRSNSFFAKNYAEQLQLDGRFFGRINNFSGRDVSLWLGKNMYFNGQFDSRNITRKDEELFNLKVSNLRTSIYTLRDLIPGFKAPSNFDRLGRMSFNGSFDGYLEDFVAFGHLKTELGEVNVNMRLDLKSGTDLATYAGDLQLKEFDLQSWTGDEDLGEITFSASVRDGTGLTIESAFAKLGATIDSISYKGYTYNNIIMDGSIDKSQFEGSLNIADENIDFSFDGSISSLDSLPQFKFKADIKKLDLFAIQLSDDPFQFSGQVDIDLSGKNLETIQGTAQADNLVFLKNDTSYVLKTIKILSKQKRNDRMLFSLSSELGDINVEGIFDLREIPSAFQKIIYDNYPQHIERLGLQQKPKLVKNQDFSFDVEFVDTRNFLELIGAKGLYLQNTVLIGTVNTNTDEFHVDINSPLISYNQYKFLLLNANIESKKQNGSFNLTIDTSFMDTKMFNPITIITAFEADTLNFRLQTTKIIDSIDLVTLSGAILPVDAGYEVKFYDDEWYMFDKSWHLNKENKIYFDRKMVKIDPLIMSDGYREIIIDDINRKGVTLKLNRFNFDLMNAIIKYDKIWFAGESSLDITLNDIYEKKDWNIHLSIPEFTMNADPYGHLDLIASGFEQDEAQFSLDIIRDDQKFEVDGVFDRKASTAEGTVETEDYPLKIFEYILKDGISETQGVVDINATFHGNINDLKLKGLALTDGAGTKVNYLGTYYTFDEQTIKITESFIDLTGLYLTDTNGNTALAVGGLNHQLFADFTLDVNISSPKFIAINTTKLDNPVYYGFGQGEIAVDFTGPFDKADIRVNAKTGEGTKVFFPIRTLQGSIDESFIKFVNKNEQEQVDFQDEIKLLGLDFEMSLEMNDKAQVSIIFDERFNEILKGTGRGNIQVAIKRNGEFDVFGDYEIEQGEYLFTAYGLVAKPFILKRGGRVTWTGDPFNARLDIKADYKGLRAPLNVFLSEYLAAATPEVQTEARKRTNIDLSLILGGTLYNPIINFNIDFPDVQGELKSYADSKMRTLQNTPNGINNQVVGLFVFRNFLPSNNPLGNLSTDDILQSGYNTISEFFFTQISLMFTSFFEQALVEKGLLSSVDFEIGLSKNTEFSTESDAGLNPDEVEISLVNRFADDRLALNLGTNFVTESPFENVGSYVLGDVVFEWYITEDRKIKLKVYGIYDYDALESGSRKQKYGVGISYRKEFGNLVDFKKSIKKAVDESIDKSTSVNQ